MNNEPIEIIKNYSGNIIDAIIELQKSGNYFLTDEDFNKIINALKNI